MKMKYSFECYVMTHIYIYIYINDMKPNLYNIDHQRLKYLDNILVFSLNAENVTIVLTSS